MLAQFNYSIHIYFQFIIVQLKYFKGIEFPICRLPLKHAGFQCLPKFLNVFFFFFCPEQAYCSRLSSTLHAGIRRKCRVPFSDEKYEKKKKKKSDVFISNKLGTKDQNEA